MPDRKAESVETESTREYFQVSVTAPSQEEASSLGQMAVERRLTACAQVSGPISSIYWWKGEVTSASEFICTLKTTADRLPALTNAIKEAHSYDLPEIVAVPIVAGDAAFLAWIKDETRTR
jgi:periplasmic divalent cation tolerance protein